MADDRTKQGEEDRSRVSGSEGYEVQYLADKLNVTPEAVKEAIGQVGNNREEIEAFLKNRS